MELENIAFSGGAMKALAFGGVIHAIDKAGLRPQIKRIAATSGGAITGCLMACGFSGEEIMNIMLKRDFSKLKDDTSLMDNIHRLSFNFGFYSSQLISKWIIEHLEEKKINGNITFREIYTLFNIEFIVPVTHLNKRKTVYFSYKETPDMSVVEAVRISSSIPIFFEAYRFRKDIYVDGGLTCNLPIDILVEYDKYMEHTLAFSVISNFDISSYREINDIIDFVNEIIMAIFNSPNEKKTIEYKNSIVLIKTGNISSVNFSLANDLKIKLFKSGYKTTKKRLLEFGIDKTIIDLYS